MDEKIKFGKYTVSVNIGFAGISRGGILDLADFYDETEWNELTAYIEYGMELIDE